MPKTALSIAAALALLVVAAPPALAAPVPAFTVDPNPPVSGVQATYTSTSTVDDGLAVAEVDWDFDNDGDFEVKDTAAPFTTTHVYANAGLKTFKMRVVDNTAVTPLETTKDQAVIVVTRPPTADFSFSPLSPFTFDDVLFAADASDPDGDALKYRWDFGDGTDDSTAHFPVHSFATIGEKTVTLTVTDPFGASDTVSHDIVVKGPVVPGNDPPVARFAWSPKGPRVGDDVEFISSSYDKDGDIRASSWDLDNDGAFDDAKSDDLLHRFTSPGTKTVRLRVTDDAGQSAIAVHTFKVDKALPLAPNALRPDPETRIGWQRYPKGARVALLKISAPKKALVTVRCKGKRCGAKQRRKYVKGRTVRFKTFERFLPAGARLQIFVAKPGKIGKYWRYGIKGHSRLPSKVTRCVKGMNLRPIRCPR